MNLKQIRKSKGFTQQEVADFIGISQNNYSYWENGKVKIDSKSLQKLAELFDVTIDYLLGKEQSILKMQNDLGLITPQQNTLFKMIMQLDNDRFYMVYGYTERLLKEMIA